MFKTANTLIKYSVTRYPPPPAPRVSRVTYYLLAIPITVQVSLAIRGGYVPEKFRTANTKTSSLGLN